MRGTYAPDADSANDLVQRFVGDWATEDGQQSGYLKGTWAPIVLSQPEGKFAGQWVCDAEVAPDGRLSGLYGVIKLADGSSMQYFRGRWHAADGGHGRLGGLIVDGGFYGLWNSGDSNGRGYLKGAWADNSFKGSWGHLGHEAEGRLWGKYGPIVTPQPVEKQAGPVQRLAVASAR